MTKTQAETKKTIEGPPTWPLRGNYLDNIFIDFRTTRPGNGNAQSKLSPPT